MENAGKLAALSYIEREQSIFTEVSDRIWENPELSLREQKAAALYKSVLKENGFAVTENLGGIETAFSGSFGTGRPVIGFLGEFDALSGMSQQRCTDHPQPITAGGAGHGCGHNMLGAGALCAAFAVKDYLARTGCPGTVIFFGCPGEEGGAAKAFLAREGAWRKLDAALTWHPSDVNEVVTGTNNSCIQILYKFHGIAAHAAGDPQNGRSALDAVELMNIGVQFLREHMADDCRVHYAITNSGGISPNVVQAEADVLYMVRANKVADSVKLLERVDKIARGAAMMTETEFDRVFVDGTAEVVPNFCLENLLYENFQAVGLPVYTQEELDFARRLKDTCKDNSVPGIGPKFDPDLYDQVRTYSENGTKALCDYLIPLIHSRGFVAGSTDVGDVSWQAPTGQIHCAAFVGGAPGHSWQNVSSGGSSIGHKALLLAGKVLALTAIDLYEHPDYLAGARAEFLEKSAEGYTCPIEEGAVPIAI